MTKKKGEDAIRSLCHVWRAAHHRDTLPGELSALEFRLWVRENYPEWPSNCIIEAQRTFGAILEDV
jgi:hypothetical protein